MGIPGIWKEIGKGERIALSKLSVEHLERTQRPLRIAIDAAIWSFQNQAGQGGKNPALRTLFYRLLKFLALPIHPVFVYDGKHKPRTKRGKTVTRYGTSISNETSKKLVQAFRFPCHTAPGEAEAECALLQKKGIVDAVLSQDVDTIAFGSKLTLRDWSKEGTRGNKCPTHVTAFDSSKIKSETGLDSDGMILVALLSGGDYDEDGIAGFGCGLACEIARAGFGNDLMDLTRRSDDHGLREWRERLMFELETNESGYFKTKHKSLKLPQHFPNREILQLYTSPTVSPETELIQLENQWIDIWNSEIDVPALRQYTGTTFEWLYKSGARKFIRNIAPGLLANRLWREKSGHHLHHVSQILERRQHFMNDGIPELRVLVTPGEVVGLDLEAEEDDPETLPNLTQDRESDEEAEETKIQSTNDEEDSNIIKSSQTEQRKTPIWQPDVPEKIWIAETIVQLGAPGVVQDWQEIQREILADPKKFAARKAVKSRPKGNAGSREDGALHKYLMTSQAQPAVSGSVSNTLRAHSTVDEGILSSKTLFIANKSSVPVTGIKDFFPSTKTHQSRRNHQDLVEYKKSPLTLLQPALKTAVPQSDQSGNIRKITLRSSVQNSQNPLACSGELNSDGSQPITGTNIIQHSCKRLTPDGSTNARKGIEGSSFEDAITISSSPPASPKSVIQASQSSNAFQGIPLTLPAKTFSPLPDSVAQRKKHRIQRPQSAEDLPQNDDHERIITTGANLFESSPKVQNMTPDYEFEASRAGNTLQKSARNGFEKMTSFTSGSKISAVSRDSLPGTWKVAHDDALRNAHIQSMATRVNYVDMTDS